MTHRERFDCQHQMLACPKCGKQPPSEGHDVQCHLVGELSEPNSLYVRAEEVLAVSCVRCGALIGHFAPRDAVPVAPSQEG